MLQGGDPRVEKAEISTLTCHLQAFCAKKIIMNLKGMGQARAICF